MNGKEKRGKFADDDRALIDGIGSSSKASSRSARLRTRSAELRGRVALHFSRDHPFIVAVTAPVAKLICRPGSNGVLWFRGRTGPQSARTFAGRLISSDRHFFDVLVLLWLWGAGPCLRPQRLDLSPDRTGHRPPVDSPRQREQRVLGLRSQAASLRF